MGGLVRILIAFLTASAAAALMGLGLAAASRRFRREKDKTVETLKAVLPGLDCGACGFAGCEAYAESLAAKTETDLAKCTPGGAETRKGLSAILGLEAAPTENRRVARLACLGGEDKAIRDFKFQGYADCEAAGAHFGGGKACKYGCLGLGSCVKVCPVAAIEHTDNGLVRVIEDKCIGCELCTVVCPTAVMRMVPADAKWFVACNSNDSPKITKALCSAGCIGCRICERKHPEGGYIVADYLSRLMYTKVTEDGHAAAAAACPPGCIVKMKDD